MMIKKINNLVLALVSSLAITTNVCAEQTAELAKMQREVDIMEKILSVALKQDTDNKVRNLSSQYLQHQGIVFNFELRGSSRWQTVFASVSDTPLPPLPELDFDSIDVEVFGEHVEVIAADVMESSREAYQQAMEVMREGADKVRILAEKERDVSQEIRDLEREKRDIEFDRKHDQAAATKELEARQKALQKSIDNLQQQQAQLTQQQQTLRDDIAQKKQARAEEQQQQQQVLLAKLDKSIALTLCDYGSGLRSLPNNEYVSFVIGGLSNNKTSKVMVFDKSAIKRCVVGDIKAEQLLSESTRYQF